MKKIRLENSVVAQVRTVPPHVYIQLAQISKQVLTDPPALPKAERKSKLTGHTEIIDAIEGMPEYETWKADYAAWETEYHAALAVQEANLNNLFCDFGIVAWRFPPAIGFWRKVAYRVRCLLGRAWQTDVPRNWVYPQSLVDAGMKPSSSPRLDYIMLEVVQTAASLGRVITAVTDDGLMEISDQEVQAALGGF